MSRLAASQAVICSGRPGAARPPAVILRRGSGSLDRRAQNDLPGGSLTRELSGQVASQRDCCWGPLTKSRHAGLQCVASEPPGRRQGHAGRPVNADTETGGIVSEFDKLKDGAEQYAKDHLELREALEKWGSA